MAYWVYLLECYKDGKFSCYYPGQTKYYQKRMEAHFSNVQRQDTKRITGRFHRVKPVWKIQVNTRVDAIKLESKIMGLKTVEQRAIVCGLLKVTPYDSNQEFLIQPNIAVA